MQVRVVDEAKSEFLLSETSSWRFFDELAAAIREAFGGSWVEQIDGLDQRYWDLRLGSALVTLHLEHYCGISLFPATSAPDPEASAQLVQRIAQFLDGYEPVA